jgi:hypothetical protein
MAGELNDGCTTSYALSEGINEIFIPLDTVNASLQVDDRILISPAAQNDNINNIDLTFNPPVLVGIVVSINSAGITIAFNNSETGPCAPEVGDYLMFMKDKKINTSGLKGYYLEAKFVNDSPTYAELFSVGAEITESSK